MTAQRLPTSAPCDRSRTWPIGLRPGVCGRLAAAGALLELVLLIGFLAPFNIVRHPQVLDSSEPLVAVLGGGAEGVIKFAAPVLAAFVAMGLALLVVRSAKGKSAWLLVIGGTILFSATLLATSPVGANDVFHNVADARTLFLHDENPSLVPPTAHTTDPYFQYVASWRETPSAYGPVWYVISGMPLPFAGADLWGNVIGQKLITAVFLLGCALLTMLLAERIRPGSGAAAGILVGWNPLLQFETAGNAHNDVVMTFFALASIYALTRRWWPAVFSLLALAIASKPMLAVLGPVLLVWMLRERGVSRRTVLLSLMLGAFTLAAVYLPFYAGKDTLAGLQREANHVTSSPGAIIYLLLQSRLHMDWQPVLTAMKLVAWPLFLAGYAVVLWRMQPRDGLGALVRASFWAVFLLVVLLTWWFMSWYLFWLVPFAVMRPRSCAALVAIAFSLCAMLMYVPHQWLMGRDALLIEAATALTGFALPLILALAPRKSHQRSLPVVLAAAAD